MDRHVLVSSNLSSIHLCIVQADYVDFLHKFVYSQYTTYLYLVYFFHKSTWRWGGCFV